MMSTEGVAIEMGASPDFALAIEESCIFFQIVSGLEKAHYIAQMYVESAGFTQFVESLNYSVEGLLATFGRHRISEAQALQYGRIDARNKAKHPGRAMQKADQRAIANIVYGGDWGRRNLGNILPNDGWDYRGQGGKQMTGRDNVQRYSKAVYGDDRVVVDPSRLQRLPDAINSGGWYWRTNRVGAYALRDDALAVSRAVNLGNAGSKATPNGLQARIAATDKAKELFGI